MKAHSTIKGIFVLSHIRALRKDMGEAGVEELRKRYGKPLNFHEIDNVPVVDENEILGHIVDIQSVKNLSSTERGYEAGRLHLKNFSTTPMWAILSPLIRQNPKWLLMQGKYIAELVYDGVHFTSEDISPTTVQLKMYSEAYPIEHFQGFLFELLAAAGLIGAVECDTGKDGAYVYTITWR